MASTRSRASLWRLAKAVPWLAISDAEQETAARDLVDRSDLLGGLDRVALSDQANAGPEQQRLGHRRGRTQHHERVHHVVIFLRQIAAAGEGRFARQWN